MLTVIYNVDDKSCQINRVNKGYKKYELFPTTDITAKVAEVDNQLQKFTNYSYPELFHNIDNLIVFSYLKAGVELIGFKGLPKYKLGNSYFHFVAVVDNYSRTIHIINGNGYPDYIREPVYYDFLVSLDYQVQSIDEYELARSEIKDRINKNVEHFKNQGELKQFFKTRYSQSDYTGTREFAMILEKMAHYEPLPIKGPSMY